MRIALAQIYPRLGDFTHNRKKILEFTAQAKAKAVNLVVFPEASLCGYPPNDLLERDGFAKTAAREIRTLQKSLPKDIAILIGCFLKNPNPKGKPYQNCAVFLQKNRPVKTFAKELLPTYDVFDEARHVEPGKVSDNILQFGGKRILVTVCEDIWGWQVDKKSFVRYSRNPLTDVKSKGIDLVVNLSASPFTQNKAKDRLAVVKKTVSLLKCPVVYVNRVGSQDELIFDGGSLFLNKTAKVCHQIPFFKEDLTVIDVSQSQRTANAPKKNQTELLRQALIQGIQGFVNGNGFDQIHLGLSGGIDSALVAVLAEEALGPKHVTLIGMPGPFSAKESLLWARQLALNIKSEWLEMPIIDAYNATVESLQKTLGVATFGIMHENLQARLRGLMLMAYGNQRRSLLLATSNKSELAVGYSTLYGDLCGALAPIGDLLKKDVYALVQHINQERGVIPVEIIDRAPSAELRPNQKDEDSLPPYPVLDPIVENLVEKRKPAVTSLEKEILIKLYHSEFKRWQAPPILKITDHAFGRGRRFPITTEPVF